MWWLHHSCISYWSNYCLYIDIACIICTTTCTLGWYSPSGVCYFLFIYSMCFTCCYLIPNCEFSAQSQKMFKSCNWLTVNAAILLLHIQYKMPALLLYRPLIATFILWYCSNNILLSLGNLLRYVKLSFCQIRPSPSFAGAMKHIQVAVMS